MCHSAFSEFRISKQYPILLSAHGPYHTSGAAWKLELFRTHYDQELLLEIDPKLRIQIVHEIEL